MISNCKFKHTGSNTNVRAVRQGPTRHPLHTFNQPRPSNAGPSSPCIYLDSEIAHGGEITYDLILHRTPIISNFKFKHTGSNTNVHAVRQAPTRHPLHTFNQPISSNAGPSLPLQYIYLFGSHCSVFVQYMRVRLRPHNILITNSWRCQIQAHRQEYRRTYELFVQRQYNIQYIHSANEDQVTETRHRHYSIFV